MNVFRLLQFFLPLRNPIGFGIADFAILGFALLLVGGTLAQDRIVLLARRLARRPGWSMALLGALPVLLRLALLRRHPIPTPAVSDDFSYLLLGDTLAHLRLANPTHPMFRFFETVFVLQQPSYSSIYPLGQGIVLALGQTVFHLPWAGVALSVGILAALIYWMLRGWVSPAWALAGGMLGVIEFGPLNQWMNNYWGGALSAIAGCLVFGSLPRLKQEGPWDSAKARNAVLLGAGVGLQVLTRPFEAVLLGVCLIPVLVLLRSDFWRISRMALVALLPVLAVTLLHDKAVTGSWTTLPYMLSRYQYGVPTTFTFQRIPQPHRELTQEQRLDFEAQKDVHGDSPETLGRYLGRLAGRVRFFRFFFLAPLYVALLFFVPSLRERRYAWVVGSIAVFCLGTNIYPYYYPHYIAAVTCLFLLMAVTAFERLWRLRVRGVGVGRSAVTILVLACVAHFSFWFGLHLVGNEDLFAATGPWQSWDYINFGDSEGRITIDRQLAAAPGKQLVFVRYGPNHLLREWVRNKADIDGSDVVWALDMGTEENSKLTGYFAGRGVWVVEPDAKPARLSRYRP